MQNQLLAIMLLPLAASVVAGLGGNFIGRAWSHRITIASVAVACGLSINIALGFAFGGLEAANITLYNWATLGGLKLQVGLLIDSLTVTMMTVVTFVSLMVHVYTIGYMKDDPGYQRFFSYISLFTFAMLTLVMSNNFLQLFFGWEAVGLVSYLLIGFWYKKPTAIFANLKAFLVNRVGDFGFLLGIAGVYMIFGTLDYAPVFQQVVQGFQDIDIPVSETMVWSGITFTCIGLFIGAMGKSAQVPLHVWLPDSMEGPTPISALIHAATMVTAGVFMVARMSPLFELSEVALNVILVIGATTALFMGFLGVIQNDIKRVVAYSTLSQLGYMVVALGASAYSVGIFHLATHAFFKALLFLAAGSVIIAMHHEQDIRKMGNLRKYMPITYITSLIGSLALIGTPFFSGFYSKEAIIEAVHHSRLAAADYAYYAVLIGVFFTALYSFRMFFLVFHTEERMDKHTRSHLRESPAVVWLPLVLLAIPSVIVSWFIATPIVSGSFFGDAIFVAKEHDVLSPMVEGYQNVWGLGLHAVQTLPFWLAASGVFVAYWFTVVKPGWRSVVDKKLSLVNGVLRNNYYFDKMYIDYFSAGSVGLGKKLWQWIDAGLIDSWIVNGSAKTVAAISGQVRKIQSGYLYHYVLVMVVGLLAFLGWVYWHALAG
ncbi:NADH-quinone oxidoreductase subunit L [Aliikangiella sp. G2MR2-5]|uniref:NADH-quinone oxidoreductase subunit L n=1 Tax=Aliikangiella sp. G2MR2-5 TaxID=2788943 RepID=UPI0018A920A0|nr:NADH-quinone oxidoreductase subunit L [Aliikangiella sp. G2MR2-5]